MKKWPLLLATLAVVGAIGLAVVAATRSGQDTAGAAADGMKVAIASGGAARKQPSPEADAAPGAGQTAVDRAAEAGKYLFLFFFKADDDATTAMRTVLDEVMKKVADRADVAAIDVADPAERAVVRKFDVGRAPMPLILALAPNGAVTGGFPGKCTEAELRDAFASPGTQKCLKALQDGKLVFLAVQNASTKGNDEVMRGVRDFQADPRFASATEVILLDPSDSGEKEFLGDLEIDPKTPEAVVAFLAPPGSAIAEFKGPTTKDELVTALQRASSACGAGGCGPGGCGPGR